LKVSVRCVVDGEALPEQNAQPDKDGRAAFDWRLPDPINRGLATVTIECDDGNGKESTTRELPVIVRDVQVDFYPEGGDLVAGVQNRVYFQARTLANRPADIQGRIVDSNNQEVARVQTMSDDGEPGINQGLGAFTFSPEPGKRYKLVIDSPIGIERTFALPSAKEQGVVMTIPDGVVDNEITVDLMSVDQR